MQNECLFSLINKLNKHTTKYVSVNDSPNIPKPYTSDDDDNDDTNKQTFSFHWIK